MITEEEKMLLKEAEKETILLQNFKEILELYPNIFDKAMEKIEVIEILKPYFQGAVFPSAIQFNFTPEEFEKIKKVF